MLEFLSNNYIYFLIAAGVLFFALIGLFVDLKKKRDESSAIETSDDEASGEVSIPEPPVLEEVPTLTNEVREDYNPAPPMAEEMPVNDVNSVERVLDDTPVIPTETFSEVTTNEANQVEELR